MRRTDRLFEIMQMFRSGKLILARIIAERLEVSIRTVYRDIETLVASGIPIEGERGVGYLLREPIFLPPLALRHEELQALHLGVEIVRQTGDKALSDAAESLLGKIIAVTPGSLTSLQPLRDIAIYATLAAKPCVHLDLIRKAVVERRILVISYRRLDDVLTHRRILPLQVEYWGWVWTCAAWCEARSAFRAFRIDRIESCADTGDVFQSTSGRTYSDYLASVGRRDPDAE